MVVKITSAGSSERLFDANNSTSDFMCFYRSGTTNQLAFTLSQGGAQKTSLQSNVDGLSQSQFKVCAVTYTNNSTPTVSVWSNGIKLPFTVFSNSPASNGTVTYTNYWLHRSPFGGSNPFPNAYTKEVLHFSYPFSDAQMLNTSTHLMTKWGLTSPDPRLVLCLDAANPL